MQQKKQVELSLSAGTRGEAPKTVAQEAEARAAKTDIEGRAALVGPAGGTVCAQQTRRPVENDRRGAFPNGDFRPNSGHRQSDTESGRRRESTSDANRRSA